ncbi:MAG: hypothetical protein A3J38_02490 [Gammaproteobacteria bacterium RIFCSPHIGHO2_12_FULL_45_9]|nr:MAG: hypothetical protein A3J38_02490 [Gammaproteobacteria bacterium RIFCSPHIGHO2_12_FULL_45_9]
MKTLSKLAKMSVHAKAQEGAAILEYAQLCGLVAAAAAVGLAALGSNLGTFFTGLSESITSLSSTLGGSAGTGRGE